VYGRKTGESAVCVKNGISSRVIETLEVNETIWMGVRSNVISHVGLVVSFVYNPPRNSRWHNPNFTRQLTEGIKLRDVHQCRNCNDGRYA
jgi:hypothetical protein